MNLKYITAATREAAEDTAALLFGLDKKDIRFEVISGEEGAQLWTLLALTGTKGEIANMDASYSTYYEIEGVYLELYEARGAGQPLESQALLQHINRKNISGANAQAVKNLITAGSGRVKIAPEQQEYIYGADMTIEISKDESEARAALLPPERGGDALTLENAKQKLLAAGVTHGVDEQALASMLKEKDYGEPYVVAAAIPPEDGENGSLVFHFSKDERTGKPREIGAGRVDYRSLDIFEPVTEGQLLLTRIPATEGRPGMSVKGKEIKQKPGKEVTFPRGKNVDVDPEKTEMRAMCSGMVQFQNNSVNVSNVYKVNGDCDMSVGNIDFDGSVHISGNVRSGHTIKATGGVVVGGTVEAATIIAGGNVEIKNGMQGADKGMIEAGGAVNAQYVERGTIIANGSVTVDVSVYSHIETGGDLTAKGKRGAIIGGRVGVAGNLIANSLGAVSNPQTDIVVGMMLKKRERIQAVSREIEKLKGEMVKLDQLDAYLKNSKDKMIPETWDKLRLSGIENRRMNEELLEELRQETDILKYEMEHATEGKAHVFDVAHTGVRIIIGSDTYRVRDEITYATFRYKDSKVVYGPCDLSKPK